MKIALLLAVLAAPSATAFQPSAPHRSWSTQRVRPARAVALPLPDVGQYPDPPAPVAETPSPAKRALAPEDAWVAQLDYDGFGREVAELGKELLRGGGEDDVRHLQKMVSWRNACAAFGLATCWLEPNVLTVAALSTWTYASWAMIAHHTCHGGYNRVDAGNFNSRGFALGSVWARARDWLDWMQPEAWNIEHNRLHHYRLNEDRDPDLVQRNLQWLRDSDLNLAGRLAVVAFFMPVWKWFYYAPNTFKEVMVNNYRQQGKELPKNFDPDEAVTVSTLFFGQDEHAEAARQVVDPMEFLTKVVGPFFLSRFVLIPAAFLLVPGVGPTLAGHALANMVLADVLTNIHGFVTIVTNHAGDDLYTFDDAVKPKSPSFYVRQIVGSANYATGTDLVDFSHGYLNYQIEHHVWPDLSMRQYQLAAPRLKAICAKYGVPYVQESVLTRLYKTVRVMIGKATMRTFPTEYEPAKDKAGEKGVTWKSTNGAIDEEE